MFLFFSFLPACSWMLPTTMFHARFLHLYFDCILLFPLWLGSLSPWPLISSFSEFFCSLSLYVHLVIAQSHSQDPSICDASVETIDEYWCYKYMFECVFASIYFLCIFAFRLFSLQWAIRHPSSFFPFLFLPPPFPCAYFLLPLSAFHRSFTGRRGSKSKKWDTFIHVSYFAYSLNHLSTFTGFCHHVLLLPSPIFLSLFVAVFLLFAFFLNSH